MLGAAFGVSGHGEGQGSMRLGTFHLIGAPHMQPPEQRMAETLEQIAVADAHGFHTAWIAEHHFSNYGYSVNPLLLIANAAARAPRIRFGQAVIVTPFWHPLRLAEDIALTDILTGGRLEVGVGRGYQRLEFDALGLRIEDSRDTFNEQLDLMVKAWTEDDFTHEGAHFLVSTPVTLLPKPLQRPYPQLWVACQSDASVDWAAAHGAFPLFSGSPSARPQIEQWCARFRERWARSAHAAKPFRIAIQRHVFVATSESEARDAVWQTRWQRRVADHLGKNDQRITAGRNDPWVPEQESSDDEWWDRLAYGTAERCLEQIRRDRDSGATDFICWFDIGGLDQATVLGSMRRFIDGVMPAVSELSAAGTPA
ncbi:MAG: LLM class flavin-dependent oxidoreductase [Chloroflexota bacterium]